ncbi:hypothetical protein [Deinococcus sp.]|uniref:hypothetical protein n=1 Tax=Deinococcus sp. TaxID=47478 RepID=UPI003CC65BAB
MKLHGGKTEAKRPFAPTLPPYSAPRLTRLGRWSEVTLVITVSFGAGAAGSDHPLGPIYSGGNR